MHEMFQKLTLILQQRFIIILKGLQSVYFNPSAKWLHALPIFSTLSIHQIAPLHFIMRSFTNYSRQTRRCFVYIFLVILLISAFIYVTLDDSYSDSDIGVKLIWAGSFRQNVKSQCSFSGKLENTIPELPIGKARHDNRRMVSWRVSRKIFFSIKLKYFTTFFARAAKNIRLSLHRKWLGIIG